MYNACISDMYSRLQWHRQRLCRGYYSVTTHEGSKLRTIKIPLKRGFETIKIPLK